MSPQDSRPEPPAPSASSGQDLRQQAEAIAREKAAQSSGDLEALSLEETRRTLHELRVHQIELEMQNEELRRAQAELDAAGASYFDFYDLAPVGYVTLSAEGLILEANLTTATLLGVSRDALVNQPISRFILKEDQDLYYLHRKKLFASGTPQARELRMLKQDGTAFWARTEEIAAPDTNGAVACRVVLSEITARKHAEETLRQQAEELRASNDTLTRFNRVAVGRELRMIELKREVNELCGRLGESPRHRIAESETSPPTSTKAPA